MRVCLPLPHVALQAVHSCQSAKVHGSGAGPLPQGLVSSTLPSQGLPPSEGAATISRLRKIWPTSASHGLQADHSPKAQSTGVIRHSSGTCSTDSIFAPLQGLPHSLFATLTLRSRKWRPVHEPSESYH